MIDLMILMLNHNYTRFENVQMKNEEIVHKTFFKMKEFFLDLFILFKLTSAIK